MLFIPWKQANQIKEKLFLDVQSYDGIDLIRENVKTTNGMRASGRMSGHSILEIGTKELKQAEQNRNKEDDQFQNKTGKGKEAFPSRITNTMCVASSCQIAECTGLLL